QQIEDAHRAAVDQLHQGRRNPAGELVAGEANDYDVDRADPHGASLSISRLPMSAGTARTSRSAGPDYSRPPAPAGATVPVALERAPYPQRRVAKGDRLQGKM